MKVKIGNRIHDSKANPLAVILDEKDKANILLMGPGESMYARFPRGTTQADAERWMNEKKT